MGDIKDPVAVIIDEIALEGLDGITIEGLFVRLSDRQEFASSLDDAYKEYIWNIVRTANHIDMFELQEPRKPLVVFNRYDHVDPELGIVFEPDTFPEEIYPHAPVDDKVKQVRGSCSTYYKRISVYNTASYLSLNEVVERWKNKLVIVASQETRNNVLMGSAFDPELELTIIQYCILERIGRSRYLGEVTQGKMSLQVTGEDPKALFYHRKFLMKHGLIVKQIHHQKSGGQNCSGSLLHLPRFYVERWPKVLYLTKRVVEILKTRENYLADYEVIRKKLGLTNSLKKLFQTTYFQRFIRTDLKLPYRQLYPDAKVNEWKSNNSNKEKMIRVIQLLDPNADVDAISARDDDYEDEDDHNFSVNTPGNFKTTLNKSFLTQVYQCIESSGVNGYSQVELGQSMGLPKLNARTVSRNLLKKGVASTFMNDVGRQRVSKFRARRFDLECTRMAVIKQDLEQMKAGLLSKALGAGHDLPMDRTSLKPSLNRKRAASISTDTLRESTLNSPDIFTEVCSEDVTTKREMKRSAEFVSDSSEPPIKRSKINYSNENSSDKISTKSPSSDQYEDISAETAMKLSAIPYLPMNVLQPKDGMRNFFQHQGKETPVMTYRIYKRINMILEYVKIHKVVDDYSKFLKLISEEEEREGLTMKIDKKSLLRLLIRLKEDGNLRLHSYLLTDGVKVKNMAFICDRNIPVDHPSMISAVEQAKMKLFIVNKDNIVSQTDSDTKSNITKNSPSLRAAQNQEKLKLVYDKKAGRKYGFCPKFIRMRTLHEFLFYLVYSYKGDSELDQNKVLPFLESNNIPIDNNLKSELTHVFVLDVDWKMFIPPLPSYPTWPKGWTIMCDILYRMPLSLFVKIFNVCYNVDGLQEYLDHPVRQHFLVRQLPAPMQNCLMAFRKYIFSIHEVLQRLCYIGLIQFGPQRLKEKDQVLIYVNRRTCLLDTTTSKPGYHQTSDENYEKVKYEFSSTEVVKTYWFNLMNICLHTQLGGRMCVQGKDIILEHLSGKPEMCLALQPVRPSQAPFKDNCNVPGDKKGAAGLDSAIFAHLKRNWNWTLGNTNPPKEDGSVSKKTDRRKARLMNLKSAPLVFTKSAIIVKRSINYLHCGKFSAIRERKLSSTSSLPLGADKPKRGRSQRNVVRRIEVRKRVKTKPYYDDIDMRALQLMSKLRVDWSAEEDSLLLLCKVATMFLCRNPRQQAVGFSAIRDVLHANIPESKNKTSRACQRRILYMMKNSATSNNVAMHLEELKQDCDLNAQFGNALEHARSCTDTPKDFENAMNEKFKTLVKELQARSDKLVSSQGKLCSNIPDTATEFWNTFDILEPKTVIKCKGTFQVVNSISDIQCAVINATINSSLCSTHDKINMAPEMFKVYHQYPDSTLRSAMAKIRQDQMVSLKKTYPRRFQRTNNYLPLSSSPYRLSITYVQLIQTKYQYCIYQEAYKTVNELITWYKNGGESQNPLGMQVNVTSGGTAAAIVDLLSRKQITFSVEIPEQVIILDPWFSETDEPYARIIMRYKDILQTYKRDMTSSSQFRKGFDDDIENYLQAENSNNVSTPAICEETSDIKEVQKENYECLHNTKQCLMPEDSEDNSVEGIINEKLLANKCSNVVINTSIVENTNDEMVEENLNVIESEKSNVLSEEKPNTLSDEYDEAADTLEYDEDFSLRFTESDDELMDAEDDCTPETNVLNFSEQSVTKSVVNLSAQETPEAMEVSYSSKDPDENLTVGINEVDITLEGKSDSAEIVECKGLSFLQTDNSAEKGYSIDSLEDTSVKCNSTSTNIAFCSSSQVNLMYSPCHNQKTSTDVCEKQCNNTENSHSSVKSNSNVMDISITPSQSQGLTTQKNNEKLEGSKGKNPNRVWDCLVFEWEQEKEWDADNENDRLTLGDDDIDSETDDTDSVINDDSGGSCTNNQQTVVARAASRIALFMMREDMENTNQMSTKQHAHDFFVVNSCTVYCKADDKLNSKSGLYSKSENFPNFLPLTNEKIEEVLHNVKKEIIKDVQEININDIRNAFLEQATKDDWVEAIKLIDFVESKKYFGATLKDLKDYYCTKAKTLSLAEILRILVKINVFLRTGQVVVRYVHHKHSRLWLLQTFKIVRNLKEKIEPSNARFIMCGTSVDDGINRSENEEISPLKSEKDSTCSTEQLIRDTNRSETANSSEIIKELQCSLLKDVPLTPTEYKNKTENQNYISLDSDTQSKEMGSEETSKEVDSCTQSDICSIQNEYLTNIDKTRRVCLIGNKNSESKEMEIEITCDVPLKNDSMEVQNIPANERVCINEDIKELELEKRVSIKRSLSNEDVTSKKYVICPKDMKKTTDKIESMNSNNQIHVAVRPWVRVNGTLNRRVLDRLLGAVLGHALHQPAITLKAFGVRFQPALQPVHTRFLVELLESLGCVRFVVQATKQKVTLFSKPKLITFVPADGTEDEDDIIVHPEVDAIIRLGQFIGEKNYSQDFLAAQEKRCNNSSNSRKRHRMRLPTQNTETTKEK